MGRSPTAGRPAPAVAVLRTPDSRFAGLPDWPYPPRYRTVEPHGYRMAYVQDGPADGPVALLLHGNPAWGYYYRRMIPALAAAGYRVVVPDLIGFGRSDKPVSRAVHTYAHHEAWLTGLIDHLELRDIHLHAHDWGGLLGLRLVAFALHRFAAVVASNTALPTGAGRAPVLFRLWQAVAQVVPRFGRIVQAESTTRLSRGQRRAYDAPFPSYRHSLGPRTLPLRVPLSPGSPAAARNRAALAALADFRRPFATAFSVPDRITRGSAGLFRATVPGAAGQAHAELPRTRHYILEDAPAELTDLTLRVFAA